MNIDDTEDDNDESPFTPSPNNFLFSIYKENLSTTMNEKTINEDVKTTFFYQCHLCRKIRENPILTCSNCVNAGQFCSASHQMCTAIRRELFLNMLNKSDYEQFQQCSRHSSTHFPCSDRMFLLKKLHLEKHVLQSKYQSRRNSSMEIDRMQSDEIQVRKARLHFIHDKMKILREQIERKNQLNTRTVKRINDIRRRIEAIENEFIDISKELQSANKEIGRKIFILTKQDKTLNQIRRERFDELYEYIFPIKQVSAIEADLAARIKDLLNAQETTVDEIHGEQEDHDEILSVSDYRYQIVNSCLSINGDYQIEALLSTITVAADRTDPDSPQSSPSRDLYEVLSALSHACQLINVIAFFLHINLPFRLHQLEFNNDNLTIDCLRAYIAKLNTNIVSSCLSQGIPIEFADVTHTPENLFKLIKLEKYPSRPKPVVYSENYIKTIEKDVDEITRTFVTEYWFDKNDDDIKDEITLLNDDEWETIPQSNYIPDDPSISDHTDSSSSTSSQLPSSIMSRSFDYFKNKSTLFIDPFLRNFKS